MVEAALAIAIEKYTGTLAPFVPAAAAAVEFVLKPIVAAPAAVPYVAPYVPPAVTPKPAFIPKVAAAPKVEKVFKPLVLNLETLGIDPKKNRIITIGFQDTIAEESKPIVLLQDDEMNMLIDFMKFYVEGGYNRIITYNGSFDFRFISAKMMFYRLSCKEFLQTDIYDMMEIMQQAKLTFMFNPQKAGTLDEWGNYLLNYPKPFTDLKMMEYYKTGEWDRVFEFADSQITRTFELYKLWRATSELEYSGVPFGAPPGSSPQAEEKESIKAEEVKPATPIQVKTWVAKCPNDLSEHDVSIEKDEFICPIDGTLIKKPAR